MRDTDIPMLSQGNSISVGGVVYQVQSVEPLGDGAVAGEDTRSMIAIDIDERRIDEIRGTLEATPLEADVAFQRL